MNRLAKFVPENWCTKMSRRTPAALRAQRTSKGPNTGRGPALGAGGQNGTVKGDEAAPCARCGHTEGIGGPVVGRMALGMAHIGQKIGSFLDSGLMWVGRCRR